MTGPTRGDVNNNPFDLEDLGIDWDGLDDPRHDDRNFCRFKTAHDGLRAGMRDLLTSWREGNRTVTKLVTKFAPPSENDTASYIANVCKKTGLHPSSVPALDMPDVLISVGKAFLCQEQGNISYTEEQIEAAAIDALGLAKAVSNQPKELEA